MSIRSIWLGAVFVILAALTAQPTWALEAPQALKATAMSSTEIRLEWRDASQREEQFLIERSLNAAAGFLPVMAVPKNVRGYVDGGLTAATTYYYRVRASRAVKGKIRYSSYSKIAQVKTSGVVQVDQQPPTVPQNLSAIAISTSRIDLTYTAATDLVGVTDYRVEH